MALYFWDLWLCDWSTKLSKYSNCTVNPSKFLESQEICLNFPSSFSSTLNTQPNAPVNACDPMQNLSQTYQTHLTRATWPRWSSNPVSTLYQISDHMGITLKYRLKLIKYNLEQPMANSLCTSMHVFHRTM